MNWCIIIPLAVGLLSAIFGYLIGKTSSGATPRSESSNTDIYKNRIAKLEADLEMCKASKTGSAKPAGKPSGAGNAGAASSMMASKIVAPKADDSPKVQIQKQAATLGFNAAEAKIAFGKAVSKDDLKIVDGIGPKIAELFHAQNVKTWEALSQCTVEKCTEVLRAGGKHFETHKPYTWPKQAKLAHDGKWAELKEWQDAQGK